MPNISYGMKWSSEGNGNDQLTVTLVGCWFDDDDSDNDDDYDDDDDHGMLI